MHLDKIGFGEFNSILALSKEIDVASFANQGKFLIQLRQPKKCFYNVNHRTGFIYEIQMYLKWYTGMNNVNVDGKHFSIIDRNKNRKESE